MKVVITGITGFIGKNLLKIIADDENQYICLVRKSSNVGCLVKASNIEYRVIDWSQQEISDSVVNADVVIHMIGQMGAYGVTYDQFESANCLMTKYIVDACHKGGVRQLIYISTPGVAGFGKRLSKEDEPYAPRGMYEQTKIIAEKTVIEGLENTDTQYTILRPDFVYGPEDTRRIKMYKNIRDRKFILTTSGKSHLCPTYVMDVVQGIMKSVGNPAAYNEIFNISAETDITVKEYLNTIAAYFNVKIIHINIGYHLSVLLAGMVEKFCNNILKKDGFVSKNKIDFLAIDHSTSGEKAKKLLKYQAAYDFRKGFAETMEWCGKMQLM